MQASDLFDLPANLPFSDFFKPEIAPWQWVEAISSALDSFNFNTPGKTDIPSGVHLGEKVYLHPSVKLPPYCVIDGSAYIGANTEIRPGAYIRKNVIIGENCVIGNACEYKNALLLNYAQTPHYNYIGDSVLGNYAHLGAGVILANLKLDQSNIIAKTSKDAIPTNMRKLGALVGDHAEVGCNAVLQPGTILAKKAVVMSTLAFSGYLAEGTIAKESNALHYRSRSF